jgi:hypothetical protein
MGMERNADLIPMECYAPLLVNVNPADPAKGYPRGWQWGTNLIGYDEIIFPAMADVNTAQLPAIMSTLTSAVYNYHISLITSGDFLTNDQTGAALPSPYANMETLLGLTRASGGNSGTVTGTAGDGSNPIMSGYTAGQTIQTLSI